MLKKFNEIFGIKSGKDDGKLEFLNRIASFINGLTWYDGYREVFNGVCFELGVNPATYLKNMYYNEMPSLLTISNGKFIEALKVICALYSYYKKNYNWENYDKMDKEIPTIISMSSTPLGIRWVEGFFYPDNIPEIDNTVVDETLIILRDFPAARLEMHQALTNLASGRHDQVLALCYKALENVVKEKSGKKGALSDTKSYKDLFTKMNLSAQWSSAFGQWVHFANEYGRHGNNPDRHNVDVDEVEASLYFTLIMIRMIIRKNPG